MTLRTSSSHCGAVAYESHGHGRPVLFVHAFPLNRHMWEPLKVHLAGYQLLCLDLQGFGETPHLESLPVSLESMAEQVAAVLESEGISRAHLVGCSMGGYVLMRLLAARPEVVASLALVDTRPGADSPEARKGRLQTIQALQSGKEEAREAFLSGMLQKLLGDSTRASHPEIQEDLSRMMGQASTESICHSLAAMAERPDSWSVLRAWNGPALIVTGEEDALIPPGEAKELARQMQQARCVVLPACGHLPSLEKPRELATVLKDFWKEPASVDEKQLL